MSVEVEPGRSRLAKESQTPAALNYSLPPSDGMFIYERRQTSFASPQGTYTPGNVITIDVTGTEGLRGGDSYFRFNFRTNDVVIAPNTPAFHTRAMGPIGYHIFKQAKLEINGTEVENITDVGYLAQIMTDSTSSQSFRSGNLAYSGYSDYYDINLQTFNTNYYRGGAATIPDGTYFGGNGKNAAPSDAGLAGPPVVYGAPYVYGTNSMVGDVVYNRVSTTIEGKNDGTVFTAARNTTSSDARSANDLVNGAYKTIVVDAHKLFGLFRQELMIPLKLISTMRIQLTLASASECLIKSRTTTDGNALGGGNAAPDPTYFIKDFEFIADLTKYTSDIEMRMENSLGNKPIEISFDTWTVNNARPIDVGGETTVTVNKNANNLKSVVTVFRNSLHINANNANSYASSPFLPPLNEGEQDDFISYQYRIGSVTVPDRPIRGVAEAYVQMKKAWGSYCDCRAESIPFKEFKVRAFQAAIDLEKDDTSFNTGLTVQGGNSVSLIVDRKLAVPFVPTLMLHYSRILRIKADKLINVLE